MLKSPVLLLSIARIGIRVFVPEVGGGNSNTGNVGRRFFENAEISADILHISVDFIKKTKELLDIVSSCSTLHDPNQFQIKAVNQPLKPRTLTTNKFEDFIQESLVSWSRILTVSTGSIGH